MLLWLFCSIRLWFRINGVRFGTNPLALGLPHQISKGVDDYHLSRTLISYIPSPSSSDCDSFSTWLPTPTAVTMLFPQLLCHLSPNYQQSIKLSPLYPFSISQIWVYVLQGTEDYHYFYEIHHLFQCMLIFCYHVKLCSWSIISRGAVEA